MKKLKKNEPYHLYLDDIRNPRRGGPWIVVRSHNDFVDFIEEYGIPEVVSFDHDLADEHYDIGAFGEWETMEELYDQFTEKTGLDSAKWLIDYCIDNDVALPKCYVHSANPAGSKNIISWINNYKKHCGETQDCFRTAW